MRLTYGFYRKGVRETDVSIGNPGGSYDFPNPWQMAASAVRSYHQDGAAEARRTLHRRFRRSTYWGPSGTAQARGWASAIRDCFDNYIRLADVDDRSHFETGYRGDLDFQQNELSVYADVVLLDPAGYAGRVVLWDTGIVSRDTAILFAAPVYAVLGAALGADRVANVEVWRLRSSDQFRVTSAEAEAALPEVEAIVRRMTQ